MRVILFILSFSLILAKDIQQPEFSLQASGAVVDIVKKDSKIYVATAASCIDIFDIDKKKKLESIKVDYVADFMGDLMPSKVYSNDVIDKKILILSQARKGARRIHIYEDNKLKLIIPYTKKLFIAKARFLDANTIIMALLSSEIISYDLKNKKQNYRVQISQSKFSDFVLNKDKDEIIIADESGAIKIHNTKDGSFKKKLKAQNLDNVFQVDYSNGIIATAGQDRRVAIYNTKNNSSYYKSSDFLIYSVGLSPSAKIVGFASDENNNISLFNTRSKEHLGVYGNNKMTLNKILFLGEKRFLGASDSQFINFYKIK
jgi:WD40 repeat protein